MQTHPQIDVEIPLDSRRSLHAFFSMPEEPQGAVIFAHGSGSGRHSSRNQFVARALQQLGLATVLADLLTPGEDAADQTTGHLRFDIPFLADRLMTIARWFADEDIELPVGLFGASTGGGAALLAAAEHPESFQTVVSRGGRPDLAGPALMRVQAPTLLIVGGADPVVLDLNRQAFEQLGTDDKRLEIIPGATHLFEEAGALDQVARLAGDWFSRHLARRPMSVP